jgi:hypothetical protein
VVFTPAPSASTVVPVSVPTSAPVSVLITAPPAVDPSAPPSVAPPSTPGSVVSVEPPPQNVESRLLLLGYMTIFVLLVSIMD